MKTLLLFLASAAALLAQNPNPCSQIRNQATAGQVLSAVNNGSTPPCQWIAGGGGGGGGTVTNIATSGPIAGGPITTTGTISCPTCVVGPASVTSGHIATFNGTTGKLIQDGGAVPTGTVTSITATSPLTGGVITTTGSIGCQAASGSQAGCLSSADWTTFNGKQASGNYITALTGDVTASGPGSVGATIANDAVTTVKILNANVTAAKMVNAGVFTGDVTTTFPAITVAKVNGIAYSATGAAHSVPVVTTANTTATYKVVPDCQDAGGNHLNFTQSSDTISCGTSGGGGGATESHTASNSAELDFTTCIGSGKKYRIYLDQILPATNDVDIVMQVGTNGTYDTGANYGWSSFAVIAGATGPSGANSGATSITLVHRVQNTSTWGGTGTYYFSGPATANLKLLTGSAAGKLENSVLEGNFVTGGYLVTTTFNNFRILASSGNLTSGVASCYAIAD